MENEEHKEEPENEKDEIKEETSFQHTEKKQREVKKNEQSLTDKFRENPYVVSTIVLGVIVLIFLATSFGGLTGNAISPDKAGEAVIGFVQAQTGGEGELVSVEEDESGLYMVTINYQDQEIPLYVTKDGNYLVQGITELVQKTEEVSGVPKSDKPEVGLYIWSYCPYGVTALEPFAQVASLLENYADFKVYLYYAGHGDFEVQQNKIQACIQKLGSDKYWEYAEKFATDIYEKCYSDRDCDLEESVALMKSLGIDSNAIMSCVETQGESLLDDDSNAAREVSVSGSPSLVVNGVKVSASRTAEAYKQAVCGAFEDAPNECAEELDSTGTTASGSC